MKTRPLSDFLSAKLAPSLLINYSENSCQIRCNEVQLFLRAKDCFETLNKGPDVLVLDYEMETFPIMDTLVSFKKYYLNVAMVYVGAQDEIEITISTVRYGAFYYIVKYDSPKAYFENLLTKCCWKNSHSRDRMSDNQLPERFYREILVAIFAISGPEWVRKFFSSRFRQTKAPVVGAFQFR